MRFTPVAIVLTAVITLTSCVGGTTTRAYVVETGGNAAQGKQLIIKYDCGSCHMIPGIRQARGMVAPPLTYFAHRTFIGGELPNSPDNLVRWIMSPRAIEAGTAMPKLGLSEPEARNIAAYLYTLE